VSGALYGSASLPITAPKQRRSSLAGVGDGVHGSGLVCGVAIASCAPRGVRHEGCDVSVQRLAIARRGAHRRFDTVAQCGGANLGAQRRKGRAGLFECCRRNRPASVSGNEAKRCATSCSSGSGDCGARASIGAALLT